MIPNSLFVLLISLPSLSIAANSPNDEKIRALETMVSDLHKRIKELETVQRPKSGAFSSSFPALLTVVVVAVSFFYFRKMSRREAPKVDTNLPPRESDPLLAPSIVTNNPAPLEPSSTTSPDCVASPLEPSSVPSPDRVASPLEPFSVPSPDCISSPLELSSVPSPDRVASPLDPSSVPSPDRVASPTRSAQWRTESGKMTGIVIRREKTTIGNAQIKCQQMPNCTGFYFKGADLGESIEREIFYGSTYETKKGFAFNYTSFFKGESDVPSPANSSSPPPPSPQPQAVLDNNSLSPVPPSPQPQEAQPQAMLDNTPRFRYTNLNDIPEALTVGPFEDFELSPDVYTTAYLIARNAGPEMYSFNPFINKQVRIVWLFMMFIVISQLFVITAITIMFPPAVHTAFAFVDCHNLTSFADLRVRGFLQHATTTADCIEEGGQQAAFVHVFGGVSQELYKLEKETVFYNSVLQDGTVFVNLLRLVCCIWVFAHTYFNGFLHIKKTLEYHDFMAWFTQQKGYKASDKGEWLFFCFNVTFLRVLFCELFFVLLQYAVQLVVLTISFIMICTVNEPFQIVIDSLAFTFISEVGSYFNIPLQDRMGETTIEVLTDEKTGKPKRNYDINYLYPDYLWSNCIDEHGYCDTGWYILQDEQKAGLLTDYKIRRPASKNYPKPHEKWVDVLFYVLFSVPVVVVLVGAVRCRMSSDLFGFGYVSKEMHGALVYS